MRVLITGVAGFIGMHTAKALLDDEYEIFGIDNLNNYYDVSLKKSRLKDLRLFKAGLTAQGYAKPIPLLFEPSP